MNLFTGMPELVDRWKKQGATVYLLLAVVAAWTVVISTLTGLEPSSLLAKFAGSFGLASLQSWLTTDAPLVVSASSEHLRHVLLLGVVALALVISVRTFRRDARAHNIEASIAMSSRACATPWLMLLIAAQQRPFAFTIVDTEIVTSAVAVACAFFVLLVLWVIAQRRGGAMLWVVNAVAALGRLSWTVCRALMVVPCGMLLTLVGPVLIAIGWLFQPVPDAFHEARRTRAEQEPGPSGSIR